MREKRLGLGESLRLIIETADDENVTAAEPRIQALFRVVDSLPTTWRWTATTPKRLASKLEAHKSSPDIINGVYWNDLVHGAETFSVLSMWRIGEVTESAVAALNADQVLSGAILGRSMLELSAAYLRVCSQLSNLVEQVVAAPNDQIATSEEMERALLKRLYGTRLGEPAEEYLAYQVLNDIDKLAKWKRGAKLKSMYEILCEVAHPNSLGFQRFTDRILTDTTDATQSIELTRRSTASVATVVLHAALWSLGWSAQAAADGHSMVTSAKAAIGRRWPDGSTD